MLKNRRARADQDQAKDRDKDRDRPGWVSRIFWWLFAVGFWGWVVYEFWQGSTQDRRWIAAAAALGFGVQFIANKIDRLERRSAGAVLRRLEQLEGQVSLLRAEIEMDRAPPPRAAPKQDVAQPRSVTPTRL
jgi:hypothetical protein